MQEIAAKAGTVAEFEALEGGSNGVAAKVLLGGKCVGRGPTGPNMNTASRMAAQAALKEMARDRA